MAGVPASWDTEYSLNINLTNLLHHGGAAAAQLRRQSDLSPAHVSLCTSFLSILTQAHNLKILISPNTGKNG